LRAFASLSGVFPNLLVSQDFADTAENPATTFNAAHKTGNYILLLPGPQKSFFGSQSDADQIKAMIIGKQSPECVSLASSGNLETGEPGTVRVTCAIFPDIDHIETTFWHV
jgi:hypothetical protein